MSAEEITDGIKSIETQAEKILEDARSKASAIIIKAKDEANEILATGMSLKETEKEREQIVKQAEDKAAREVSEAKQKASEIRTGTGKQVEDTIERIVNIVTGADN